MATEVHRMDETQWGRVAAIRLRALEDAPDAFGSAIERERRFTEQHWRMRLRGTPTWLAVADGTDLGIVSALQEPGTSADERHLVSLWVAPDVRGAGTGRSLLAAAERWASSDGASRMTAWVVRGNERSERALAAAGYSRTGVAMPLPRDPAVTEDQWAKDLDAR